MSLKRARKEEAGQSSLELALVAPILLLFTTGMFNFGIAVKNYSVLTDAVNIATRQLAISRGQTTDPCAVGSNAVAAAAPSLSASNMTFTTDISSGIFDSPHPGTSCSSSNTYSGPAGELVFQGTVRITVTYPCFIWTYGKSTAPSCLLKASTAQTVQ